MALICTVSTSFAFVLSACGPNDSGGSNTPKITVEATANDLSAFLMSASDVHNIAGLTDAVTRDINDMPLFENPDPRGPCGAVSRQPQFAGASGRALTGASLSLVQLVMTTTAEQRDDLKEMIGDRHPACGPYQSTTNRGDQQTVSEIAFVDLPGAKDAIAWTCRVDVAGVTAYAGVIQIVAEPGTTFIQLQSNLPIAADVVAAIGERAMAKLIS